MSNIAVIVESRNIDVKSVIGQHLQFLPDNWTYRHFKAPISSPVDYNNLLTSELFWASFFKFDRVLIFQHDSGILREGVEEFLDYSYVGAPWFKNAPWAREDRAGGNGGLSLRCPKKALNLIREIPYHAKYGNEDVYFTRFLENVAPYEVCKRFSVETEFQLGTFGYHAIEKHHSPQQVEQIKTQYV